MARYYELIERRSGNLVGSYESRDAVAAVVRRSFELYGPPGIESLVLSEVDEEGNDEPVAFGIDLVRLLLEGEIVPHVTGGQGLTSAESVFEPTVRGAATRSWRGSWLYERE